MGVLSGEPRPERSVGWNWTGLTAGPRRGCGCLAGELRPADWCLRWRWRRLDLVRYSFIDHSGALRVGEQAKCLRRSYRVRERVANTQRACSSAVQGSGGAVDEHAQGCMCTCVPHRPSFSFFFFVLQTVVPRRAGILGFFFPSRVFFT